MPGTSIIGNFFLSFLFFDFHGEIKKESSPSLIGGKKGLQNKNKTFVFYGNLSAMAVEIVEL